MIRNEFTFPSADGKTTIHAAQWAPEREVRAVLQISHGIAEYILRYEPFAAYLTEHHIAVIGHDHLGHGLSVAPGAPRLHFGGQGSWDFVVKDVLACHLIAKKHFPGVPMFLLGHSMGSFIARSFLIRCPGKVDGAILMGTGYVPSAFLPMAKHIAAREARKYGGDHTSPKALNVAFESANKRFAPNRTDFDWLSRNEENVDAYIADPLCGGQPTIRLVQEMLENFVFIQKPEHLRRMDPSTPVLFVSGANDPVGNFGKGVETVQDLFRKAGVQEISSKLYPNLRHEILNETERETVFEDVSSWLLAHVPAEKATL